MRLADPLGELKRSPRPLSRNKGGLLLREGGGQRREGEGRGGDGERRGKGREGEGRLASHTIFRPCRSHSAYMLCSAVVISCALSLDASVIRE